MHAALPGHAPWCVSAVSPQEPRLTALRHAGDFEAEEPVISIFTWVEAHLRIQEAFNLASPALASKDKRLPQQGTVKSLDLMPSFVLNFSWQDHGMRPPQGLCLSEEALALITAEAA